MNPPDVRWDRVVVDPRRGYVALLLFRGGELWRCEHHHTGRGAVRACADRACQVLRDYLTPQEAAA